MVGGFLSNGGANTILSELSETDIDNLTIIVNDTSFPDKGVGKLITNKKVKKVITSHIGTNASTIEQMNNDQIEVEFSPQGTLAERIRCGGNGLGGFLTKTGLNTLVDKNKRKIEVHDETYLLETPLKADIALIGASIADKKGNLIYKGTTQNMNPLMAAAAEIVIVEAQEIVETGEFKMEAINTPFIFTDYLIQGK